MEGEFADFLVFVAIAAIRERSVAFIARIGLLARVRPNVLFEIDFLRKFLRTDRARKWFLARVNSDVLFEGRLAQKPFAAMTAFESALDRVRSSDVLSEVFLSHKL